MVWLFFFFPSALTDEETEIQRHGVSYSVTRIGGGSEDFSSWTASLQKPKGSDGVGGYVQLLSKLLIPVV